MATTVVGDALDSDDDGGCGCRITATDRSNGRWVLLALGLAWLGRGRRSARDE